MSLAETAVILSRTLELPDELMYSVASTVYRVVEPAYLPFNAALYQHLPEQMAFIDGVAASYIHPLSKQLPLMTPSLMIFSAISYFVMMAVLFVVGKILGKMSLRFFGILHNLFLYLLSAYMCVSIGAEAIASGYSLWNNSVHDGPRAWRMAKLVWLFYVSKLPEFLDTAIMILKQNYRQVSFLHVYHHCTIFIIWWLVVLHAPGGEAYWSAMVNSGVHVLMYGYYLLNLIFTEGAIRNFLQRNKFLITYLQMFQFAMNCVQSAYDMWVVPAGELKYPILLIQILFYYMITLLFLFGNFLVRNKSEKKSASKLAKPVAAASAAKKKAH